MALISLGEESGRLVENLQVAARQEEKQRLLRSKVRSAMMYPAFVLSLTVIIDLGVAWFLLPKLSDTFSQLDVELPLISRIFIGFGEFLRANGVWAVPSLIGGLMLVLFILFGAPKTKNIGHRLVFHIPGIARLMREIEIARFGYLMGTLLQSGLAVTQALELLVSATSAPNYKKFYQHLYDSFDNGFSFKESIKQYKHVDNLLPGALQQMVIAGEHSGSLPETLQKVGDMYEEKSDLTTENLETLLEPILLIIVWLGVMAVAVAVILPVYSLIGGLDAVQ
jgi:type IV pilus assembly protein PilC